MYLSLFPGMLGFVSESYPRANCVRKSPRAEMLQCLEMLRPILVLKFSLSTLLSHLLEVVKVLPKSVIRALSQLQSPFL